MFAHIILTNFKSILVFLPLQRTDICASSSQKADKGRIGLREQNLTGCFLGPTQPAINVASWRRPIAQNLKRGSALRRRWLAGVCPQFPALSPTALAPLPAHAAACGCPRGPRRDEPGLSPRRLLARGSPTNRCGPARHWRRRARGHGSDVQTLGSPAEGE